MCECVSECLKIYIYSLEDVQHSNYTYHKNTIITIIRGSTTKWYDDSEAYDTRQGFLSSLTYHIIEDGRDHSSDPHHRTLHRLAIREEVQLHMVITDTLI